MVYRTLLLESKRPERRGLGVGDLVSPRAVFASNHSDLFFLEEGPDQPVSLLLLEFHLLSYLLQAHRMLPEMDQNLFLQFRS